MERYNVGPHRKHSVWMMAGHKITEQDYAGFITQAKVKDYACTLYMYSMSQTVCFLSVQWPQIYMYSGVGSAGAPAPPLFNCARADYIQ